MAEQMRCPYCAGAGVLTAEQVHSGTLIMHTRKERGLTQDDLAKLVGLSRTQITNIEVGRSDMPLKTLARFAEALQVSMKDLVP